MSRRAIIITGGTTGLGFEAARAIATGDYPGAEGDKNGYLIVLASRADKEDAAGAVTKAAAAAGRSRNTAVFRRIDLADLASVRQFAADWTADHNNPPLHALLLNAALQFPGALETTVSGLEATFAITHVGNAALFHLLAPCLDAAPIARVVITASGVHDPAQKSGLPDAVYTSGDDLARPPPKMLNGNGRQHYSNSKLANVLWTYALDSHLRAAGKAVPADGDVTAGITATAFDPGLMPGTGLARGASPVLRFVWTSVLPHILPLLRILISHNIHTAADSGRNLARLAVGSDVQGVSGKYYEIRHPIPSSKDSYIEAKQEDLWDWTIQYIAKDNAEAQRFRNFE